MRNRLREVPLFYFLPVACRENLHQIDGRFSAELSWIPQEKTSQVTFILEVVLLGATC